MQFVMFRARMKRRIPFSGLIANTLLFVIFLSFSSLSVHAEKTNTPGFMYSGTRGYWFSPNYVEESIDELSARRRLTLIEFLFLGYLDAHTAQGQGAKLADRGTPVQYADWILQDLRIWHETFGQLLKGTLQANYDFVLAQAGKLKLDGSSESIDSIRKTMKVACDFALASFINR